MASIRKCPKCGYELADTSSAACPMCGTVLGTADGITPEPGANAARSGARIWIGALLQFAVLTTFMLVFRFPKFMIAFFGVIIVLGTALSAWAKQRQLAPRPGPRPLSHPTLYKVLSLGIAFCSVVLFSTLLFGFVIFLNNWNDWHRYEGQPYHRTDFVVTHTYYQRGSKGAVDAYASGMVDGNREWMSLRPYLPTVPRSEAELDQRVPIGTSIPIDLFPEMKGRLRVRVYSDTPAAEGYHRAAINALDYGLGGAALSAAVIFVLIGLRRLCFAETDSSIQQLAASQGG
ncbi:MAG: hypothetical protein WA485_06715 [Candidatus Sulfotelmatobacter sp.]